ncbi:MAG: RidA family protein [Alphaproteobacteria bacterium]|nr:RidA family protein [Alphaproteobacteria bacterium]
MQVFNPAGWPRPKGYSNGIKVSGDMIFLAGLVGWNEKEEFETDSFAGQARQIFKNAVALLAEAGAQPHHIVRMTWYITNKAEYLASQKELGAAYREVLGRHFPVMAVVQIAGLIETGAKLEIEFTAVVPKA